MAKVKLVKELLDARSWCEMNGLDKFSCAPRVVEAYSDDIEGLEEGIERNLNFFSKDPVDGATLIKIMSVVVPGYNAFDGVKSTTQLVEVFGEDAKYFIAREGSVAIYVKPNKGNVWMGRDEKGISLIQADEVLFDSDLGLFRVWWD